MHKPRPSPFAFTPAIACFALLAVRCGGASHPGATRTAPDAGADGASADGAAPDAGAEDGGLVVYDPTQKVYWLANANLASDPSLRTELGVAGINPNGTMDYPTAQAWVKALNGYQNGSGYLGHHNWQLPVTPPTDSSCSVASGPSGNSFGVSCTGSALGSLYSVFLGHTYPDSVDPGFVDVVGPFVNLQASLYWTADQGTGSDSTFSFTTGLSGSNTTKYNYFFVLPMHQGAIGGTVPTGSGVVPYQSGPAAGLAVYDTATQISWARDANMAASNAFGVTGTTTVTTASGKVLSVPRVDASGSMLFATANAWMSALNQSGFPGAGGWTLPSVADLKTLFGDLKLQAGDVRLASQGSVGAFENLQPFFYWACPRDQNGNSQSPCNGSNAGTSPNGTTPMEWSFNLESGFQGTDENSKQFYVLVYYPAP